MKRTLFLILIFLGFSGLTFSQANFPENQPQNNNKVYIDGQIIGAENQKIYLGNQNLGGAQKPMFTTTANEKGAFVIEVDIPFNDYYFLRFENGQMLNLVLYKGDSLSVFGDSKNILKHHNIIGSIHSVAMNEFLREYIEFKTMEDSLKLVIRTEPEKQAEVDAYFGPRATAFYTFRNNFINGNTQSPALVVTFNTIDADKEWELYKSVVGLLESSFPESPTIMRMRQYVDQLEAQKEATAFLNPGKPAKEIALLDTSRTETLKLSDLKGKVVLIDFWASWCRPCRAENPNVVKLYHKYNEEGFEVFSVSLDSDLNRWKMAIIQDGLVWPYHVSDLKKWQSVAAKDYAVSSIPFTVLIDREGNVIATKLRGTALENQLKVIFGH